MSRAHLHVLTIEASLILRDKKLGSYSTVFLGLETFMLVLLVCIDSI